MSTPVWNGLQGAKFKHIKELNIQYKEINIKYPIDKQPSLEQTYKEKESDSEIVSKREQSMDKDLKAQNKIFEMLHKSYKPRSQNTSS